MTNENDKEKSIQSNQKNNKIGLLIFIIILVVLFLRNCVSEQPKKQEVQKVSQESSFDKKKSFEEFKTKVLPIIKECDDAYEMAVKSHTKDLYQKAEDVCYAASLNVTEIPFDAEKTQEEKWGKDENQIPAFAPLRYKIFDMLQEKSDAAKIAKNRVQINKKTFDDTENLRLSKYNQLKKSVEESFEYYQSL